jgi:arylsulfatase
MACITEAASGFPNANGHIPFECANLAEVLGARGWNTYHVGKWHLCAEDEMNMASSKRQWPLGRGFERFYGFLGGETNQWYPDLIEDNHPVAQPSLPEDGYHLSVDLTDKAIEFVKDAKAIAPEKPFFLYYCPGAAHAPHHVPQEWADRYRGVFDEGYEAYRETVLARQKELGIVPPNAELSPINPYVGTESHDGKPWSQLDVVRPWETLDDDEKRLFARMAEVYAGFLSHADAQLGRLLDYLEESEQLENTLIMLVSDNGASGEGGPNGSINENKLFNGIPDSIEENLAHLDELGGPRTYNHYATGWACAFNTPFKLWKRYSSYRGGTADPLIVSWPKRITAAGETREQYAHAVDLVPTVYECLGIDPPDEVNGYVQKPIEGLSLAYSLGQADAPTRKETQFYSMLGTRAIWHKGWKAATAVPAAPESWGGLPSGAVGALRHRGRPERVPRPRRVAPGEAPGADRPLVGRGRREAGPPPRVPDGDRDPRRGAAAALEAAFALRLLPGRRGDPRVGRAEHPQPLVHDRGRGRDRDRGGGRRHLLAGLALRRPCPLHRRRQAEVRLQLGRRARPDNRVGRPGPHGPRVPLRVVRQGERGAAGPGTLSLYIRDEKAGEGKIMTQPGKFGLGGGGLVVGRSGAEPVTDDFGGERPWPFVGGTVKRVLIDVSGEPFVDLAEEAKTAFAHQ